MSREQTIQLEATSASGTSWQEMLIPSQGAVLSIDSMTSGNVNIQSYETGSWVTVETYTADQIVNVPVAPGILVRITWDTVVGTPNISLLPGSDNGFAEVANDIVVIEGDITQITDAQRNIYIYDVSNGNLSIPAGSDSISGFATTGNGSPPTVVEISIDDSVALTMPTIIGFANTSDTGVSMAYSSNPGSALLIPPGVKTTVVNIPDLFTFSEIGKPPTYAAADAPSAATSGDGAVIRITDVGAASTGSVWSSNGTSWFPSNGGSVVLGRSAVQVTDSASGNDLIYVKIPLPPIIMHANAAIRIRAGFSCTSSTNTKTYRAHLSANSYSIGGTVVSGTIMAAMTGQNSIASHVFEAVINNRNSVSSQAGMFAAARNPGTVSVGTATSSIDTSAATTYLYITAQKATAGETVTLEFYTAEIC